MMEMPALNDKCMDGICVGQSMDCDDGDSALWTPARMEFVSTCLSMI